MINSTDLRNGTTFIVDGAPYVVLEYKFIKMGRGGATVRVTAKNLKTGSTEEKTYSSNVTVEDAQTSKKALQYLYQDGEDVVFMDPRSFEQATISRKVLKDQIPYLREGDTVNVLYWSFGSAQDKEDEPLLVELPLKIELKVTDTDPGIKGNSAANMLKNATLENGLIVRVPLFIKNGDKVRVDTRSGAYVERVAK